MKPTQRGERITGDGYDTTIGLGWWSALSNTAWWGGNRLGRDRFTKTEWGDGNKTWRDFGYCDNGFRLGCREEAEAYRELKDEGYTVTKHGWPDLLATLDDVVRVIEVKSETDSLKASQKRVIAALAQLGVTVEVQHRRNPNRKPLKRRRT